MYRFDPKVKALVNQEVQEVEAHTQEIDEQDATRTKRPLEGQRPDDQRRRRCSRARQGHAGNTLERGLGKDRGLGRGRRWNKPLSRPLTAATAQQQGAAASNGARLQQCRRLSVNLEAPLRIQRDPTVDEWKQLERAGHQRQAPAPGTEPRPQATPKGWTSHQSEAAWEVTGSGMG